MTLIPEIPIQDHNAVTNDSKDKSYFENYLKENGKSLQSLRLTEYGQWDEEILDLVLKECPNLQEVEIGYQYLTKKSIEALKPVFDKIRKLQCSILKDDVDDEDLKNLFLKNEILEHLTIMTNRIVKGTFLDSLPRETMKELVVNYKRPAVVDNVCRVSAFSNSIFFFKPQMHKLNNWA